MKKFTLLTIPILMFLFLMFLSGCTQVVTAPISVAGSVAGATIDITGSAVGAAVNVATSGSDDEEDEK
ncbi:hypothetical protein YH65_02755 [Sulfurovum lithotrophicum]|uniref:Lipoprotein n=1 Tax=Sulfurovum lithotrophicum TaxID=206403 RepID=A0A7U4M090_9BACT|nr:hypothetical protein YH65_02755 [Sulfurovum lithotrophicum]